MKLNFVSTESSCHKRNAFVNYKGPNAYQSKIWPMVTYCFLNEKDFENLLVTLNLLPTERSCQIVKYEGPNSY